jgi:hypothetical protein
VIVNTHSPAVFQQVSDDRVLFVKAPEAMNGRGHFFKSAQFSCLPDTWRAKGDEASHVVARGDLLAYLNPVLPRGRLEEPETKGRQRVVDREDTQQLLLLSAEFVNECKDGARRCCANTAACEGLSRCLISVRMAALFWRDLTRRRSGNE